MQNEYDIDILNPRSNPYADGLTETRNLQGAKREMKEDWRLNNQEKYLMNKTLYRIPFQPYSSEWDHEHCEFCYEKFSEDPNDLHEGYCTEPINQKGARWICPKCYQDFQSMFNWLLKE